MNYETNVETNLRRFPIMTVIIGKDVDSEDEEYSNNQIKPHKSPQIKNKKEVVKKLIKYFKTA
jgi:hypothetical protein